jgi:hypothetical protein
MSGLSVFDIKRIVSLLTEVYGTSVRIDKMALGYALLVRGGDEESCQIAANALAAKMEEEKEASFPWIMVREDQILAIILAGFNGAEHPHFSEDWEE